MRLHALLHVGGCWMAGGDFIGQAAQAFFVAAKLEADRLLDPQGIGDQLLLPLIAFKLARLPGQPEHDGDEQQHQYHRQQPAHGRGQGYAF